MKRILVIMLVLLASVCGASGSFYDTITNAESITGINVGVASPSLDASKTSTSQLFDQVHNAIASVPLKASYEPITKKYSYSVVQPISSPTAIKAPDTIESLKLNILKRYGIEMVNEGSSWTIKQLQEVTDLMKKLPSIFWKNTKTIRRVKNYNGTSYVLGYVYLGLPDVYLCDSSVVPGLFSQVLVHEMTHTFQGEHIDIAEKWKSLFWANNKPRSSSPTSYGNTHPYEDMAESVKFFYFFGAKLKSLFLERYNFIMKYVFGGKEFN